MSVSEDATRREEYIEFAVKLGMERFMARTEPLSALIEFIDQHNDGHDDGHHGDELEEGELKQEPSQDATDTLQVQSMLQVWDDEPETNSELHLEAQSPSARDGLTDYEAETQSAIQVPDPRGDITAPTSYATFLDFSEADAAWQQAQSSELTCTLLTSHPTIMKKYHAAQLVRDRVETMYRDHQNSSQRLSTMYDKHIGVMNSIFDAEDINLLNAEILAAQEQIHCTVEGGWCDIALLQKLCNKQTEVYQALTELYQQREDQLKTLYDDIPSISTGTRNRWTLKQEALFVLVKAQWSVLHGMQMLYSS